MSCIYQMESSVANLIPTFNDVFPICIDSTKSSLIMFLDFRTSIEMLMLVLSIMDWILYFYMEGGKAEGWKTEWSYYEVSNFRGL